MNFVTFVVDRRVWDPGVVRSCEEEEEGCFALLCLQAVAMAMAVAPPMATLQGGLAAASTGLPRSSYLGLQLAAGQSPAALLPFFASNYRSSNSSQLRFRCQASSSSTTLPQLNVDISGVCVCVCLSLSLYFSLSHYPYLCLPTMRARLGCIAANGILRCVISLGLYVKIFRYMS